MTTVLGQKGRRLAKRLDELERGVLEGEPDALKGALRELREALEELGVADEELQAQADELADARELLAGESDRYRALFELAPDAYLLTDPVGKILEANRAAELLFAVPHQFLVGKVVAGFVPLEDRASFRRQLLKMADAHGISETEWRFDTRPRVLDVSVSIAPVRKGGQLHGFRWIVRDVTARKQAEWELRTLNVELERRVAERTRELDEERARLDAIVEQMAGGLVIANVEGEPVFMNRRAEDLLAKLRRTDEKPFYRRYPALRLNGEPYPEAERPSLRALRPGETTTAERLYYERVDGEKILFEASAAPIRDSTGRITAAAITLYDLSDRERVEQVEREFVAHAAHELRTPIAAVLSAVEVLQAGAKERPEDRDLFLGHIEREAGRLGRLAHALLVLARAQAGSETVEPQLVDLDGLLTEVGQSLDASEGVEVVIDCPRGLRVRSNRDLLEQALTSVALNAAANTDEGSVTLVAHADESVVAIEVRDTGCGINSAEQERIFERFYRSSGGNGSAGFGLGLAIARQAAEALAADIDVESQEGVGTTIRLRLPPGLVA